MQNCNTKHHHNLEHKEIPNKRNMPQTNSTTSHFTPWLCKLNAGRIAIIKYKNNAKSPKHSCKTNPQKTCHGKHHRVPQNPTLATNTTEDRLKNMHSHPQVPQQISSNLSPKPNIRENNNFSQPQIRKQKISVGSSKHRKTDLHQQIIQHLWPKALELTTWHNKRRNHIWKNSNCH